MIKRKVEKSDWQAASRELMAEARARLGPPPTAEEMLAYTRGELSEKEEARVRELLVCYPELARSLPEPFPSEGALPGDSDFLTDAEVANHWASVQRPTHTANAAAALRAEPRVLRS